MATVADVLADAFSRVHEAVHDAVDGLTVEQLSFRLDPQANTIAWLVWHLTRIQDDHIAAVAATDQAWTAEGWCDQFGLPFSPDAHGYGQGSDEVAAVRAPADLLLGYYDAVHRRTIAYVEGLTEAELDRVVDERFQPPVTLAVRLVSVINDDLEHAGQAALIHGVVERLRV